LERQKVQWAADIFCDQLINTLKVMSRRGVPGFENLNETIKFMNMIRRWWTILNNVNVTKGLHLRIPDAMPFISEDDMRFDFLDQTFLSYIAKWKKTSKGGKSFLTQETYNALVTTTRSTVDCIKYLLQLGFEKVLTRRFSSDHIEQFFGQIRQLLGGNYNGDALSVLRAVEKIIITGIAYSSVHSNVHLHEESWAANESVDSLAMLSPTDDTGPRQRRLRAQDVLCSLPEEIENLLINLSKPAGIE
jgi:hypothetical protein